MDSLNFSPFGVGRRYGIELEYNSFDGRDFIARPLGKNELPQGTQYVSALLAKTLGRKVEIKKWHHTSDNNCWIVKPDASCGIEVCSPVFKGRRGMDEICEVVDSLGGDDKIKSGLDCSFHIHVEVADLMLKQVAVILAYWIKCEAVFLDSVPKDRKVN